MRLASPGWMRPGVWGPLCVVVVVRGRAVGGWRTNGSRSSAQLPLYRTCTLCWIICGRALAGSDWPLSLGGSGQRHRGARAMMSSAADRCDAPSLLSSTIEWSQQRAAATRVRLRRGSSD
eukprot:6475566-Amphidinium_carterae.2